jgi:hypothetical protein
MSRRLGPRPRWLVVLASLGAAVIALADAAAPASASSAAQAGEPGRPDGPGWANIWTDSFNGSAGSGVDTSAWKYNTGTGVFGTGEIETMTNSTSNVHLDGQGNLDLTALGHGQSWTSGRIQTISSDFGAPAGGEMAVTASIRQPNPAVGLGYWPAF